jgi:hypothetical protein
VTYRPKVEPDEKRLTKTILDLITGTEGWNWKRWLRLIIAVAVAVVLALLHGGCVQPGAAKLETKAPLVAVDHPSVDTNVGVWPGNKVADNLEIKPTENELGAGATQGRGTATGTGGATTVSVNVGKGSNAVLYALAAFGLLALCSLVLAIYLWLRKRGLSRLLGVLTDSIEAEGPNCPAKKRVAARLKALPKEALLLDRTLLRQGRLARSGP